MKMTIKEIFEHLPHRYPFLLVDRVVDVVPGESIHALKNVTFNEPFFSGHFPGEPVMPGVLMIEAMAQAAGIIILTSDSSSSYKTHQFVLVGVNNVKFKRMVTPGDQLHIYAKLEKTKSNIWKFSSEIKVDDALVCSANITNAQVKK